MVWAHIQGPGGGPGPAPRQQAPDRAPLCGPRAAFGGGRAQAENRDLVEANLKATGHGRHGHT